MKLWLAKLKYYLLRKYLIEEMIRQGWRQDPKQAGRLINCQNDFTWNMAEHEAISRHFKEFPLFQRSQEGS